MWPHTVHALRPRRAPPLYLPLGDSVHRELTASASHRYWEALFIAFNAMTCTGLSTFNLAALSAGSKFFIVLNPQGHTHSALVWQHRALRLFRSPCAVL